MMLLETGILILLCFHWDTTTILVRAQGEGPNPTLELPLLGRPTNGETTFRTNFCPLVPTDLGGRIDQALQDVDLHVGVFDNSFVNFDVEYHETADGSGTMEARRSLNAEYPGLMPALLDELCRRAGCRWRNTYAALNYDITNSTFLDLLLWSTDMYDLSADWWLRSATRLRAGVTFLDPWYDGTIILVAKKEVKEEDSFDPWGFLAPFDYQVWIMILATAFLSAAVYWLLEIWDPKTDGAQEVVDGKKVDGANTSLSFEETLWLIAIAFVGQFEFAPKTSPARLFTFSITFWSLLMITAYTANLASFLVNRRQVTVRAATVPQVIDLSQRMCVWRSSSTDTSITKAFPTYARSGLLVRVDTRQELFDSLHASLCDVIVTEASTWDVAQNDENLNGDCSLEWIGRPFEVVEASFALKADSRDKCTSLLRDVLNLYMHDMENDGTIDALWEEYLVQTTTVDCFGIIMDGTPDGRRLETNCGGSGQSSSSKDAAQRRLKALSVKAAGSEMKTAVSGADDEEETELTLVNMAGVFMVHAILTAATLLWAFLPWLWRHFGFCSASQKDTVTKDSVMGPSVSDRTDRTDPTSREYISRNMTGGTSRENSNPSLFDETDGEFLEEVDVDELGKDKPGVSSNIGNKVPSENGNSHSFSDSIREAYNEAMRKLDDEITPNEVPSNENSRGLLKSTQKAGNNDEAVKELRDGMSLGFFNIEAEMNQRLFSIEAKLDAALQKAKLDAALQTRGSDELYV